MSCSEIIQIVPYLPPKLSGVGDYALLLARELRETHDLHTRFILCDPAWVGPSELEGFPVARIPERARQGLATLLGPERGKNPPLLLHYVGYGYEHRGCPSWLVSGLEAWRDAAATNCLATFFHELYVPRSRIWNSSFWNAGWQRKLTARLAQISDSCFTNRAESAKELEKMAPRHAGRIAVRPVFSNFGEPAELAPVKARPAQAVQFGGFGRGFTRRDEAVPLLLGACRQLGIERLVAIGADLADLKHKGLEVQAWDRISPAQASKVLSNSRVGFLDYFDGYLGKSGIFAAYCSHALVPVLFSANRSEADGLRGGRHFLVASPPEPGLLMANQQEIADAAREWYRGHGLAKTTATIAAAMRNPVLTC